MEAWLGDQDLYATAPLKRLLKAYNLGWRPRGKDLICAALTRAEGSVRGAHVALIPTRIEMMGRELMELRHAVNITPTVNKTTFDEVTLWHRFEQALPSLTLELVMEVGRMRDTFVRKYVHYPWLSEPAFGKLKGDFYNTCGAVYVVEPPKLYSSFSPCKKGSQPPQFKIQVKL